MKLKFEIILFIGFFNFIFTKSPELLSISVYENSIKKDTYNITLINSKSVKISKETSKLAYITDIEKKDSIILSNFTKFYNKIWLFLTTEVKEMQLILDKHKESNGVLVTGLIIPETLDYREIDLNEYKKIPVFTISEYLVDEMGRYDIRKNKKNVYFIINYIEKIFIQFFIIFSSFCLITAIFLGVAWNIYEKKVGPNYIFQYHEKVKYILCSHIFLAVTLIFKTISIVKTQNYELSVAVEISLYLSVSFFRTFLWFLIYLISSGWNIVFQEMSLNEQKRIYRLFIIIAVFFWIDDILDNYCGTIWIFLISEIKNIFLFAFITFLTQRNINKNLNMLKRKYNYALLLLHAYAEAINEKIKLLTSLKYQIFSYLPIYLLILINSKMFLDDYDDNPVILLYIDLIPDFLLEFAFVYLMRPKIVANYYNIDLGDILNEEESITYICELPKFEEFNDELMKKDIKKTYHENYNIPIIVLGPEKAKNISYIDDEDETDPDKANLSELDINKYSSNIQVGYCQEEEKSS